MMLDQRVIRPQWIGGGIEHYSPKTVYLLHFSESYANHARHYIGITSRTVGERLNEHQFNKNGRANPLCAAASVFGIKLLVVRTWQYRPGLERQLKNHKNASGHCPLCQKGKVHPQMGEPHNVYRASVSGKYRRCNWCGNTKRTLYSYAASVRDAYHFADQTNNIFCNKSCYESYYGLWPHDSFGPLDMQMVSRREYEEQYV